MCTCVSAENRKAVNDHEAKYYLLHLSHCYVCLMTGLYLSAEWNCLSQCKNESLFRGFPWQFLLCIVSFHSSIMHSWQKKWDSVAFYIHRDSGMEWRKRGRLVTLNFRVNSQYDISMKSINRDKTVYSCDLNIHLFLAVCIVFNK